MFWRDLKYHWSSGNDISYQKVACVGAQKRKGVGTADRHPWNSEGCTGLPSHCCR